MDNEIQDEIIINLKNINLALWNRRFLILKIFTVVFCLFNDIFPANLF